MWHDADPIGICVFGTPARSLRQRSRYFGLAGGWTSARLRALNEQIVTVSRVVLHPTYRGAGLASAFLRASCRHCAWPWIEALAEMGHMHPLFERAGFVRVGTSGTPRRSRHQHSALYGVGRDQQGHQRLVTAATYEKSRHAAPLYFIYDNRGGRSGDE